MHPSRWIKPHWPRGAQDLRLTGGKSAAGEEGAKNKDERDEKAARTTTE